MMMCSKNEIKWLRCSPFEVTIKPVIRRDTRERLPKKKKAIRIFGSPGPN